MQKRAPNVRFTQAANFYGDGPRGAMQTAVITPPYDCGPMLSAAFRQR